jgi:excinuclease ABC subunit C
MVTLINGEFEKSFYRHFKIISKKKADDISAMKEIAGRRIKHFSDWGIPDLIIVDGGKPQVSGFWGELHQYNIPIVGLAKRFEILVIPQIVRGVLKFKEIKVPKGPALFILQRARDEAHRFARRLHHKLVQKNLLS